MKKIIKISFVLIVMVLLSGCQKQEIVKCNLISNQSSSNYNINVNTKIYSRGSIVNKIVTVEEIESTNNTILSYFEKQLKDQYESYNKNYGGYTYKITNKKGKVTANVTIDYNKVDLKKFISSNPAMESYVNNNKLSLEGATKMYESTGAKCNK